MRIYHGRKVAALVLFLSLISWNLSAQVLSPVKWSFQQKKISEKEIEVSFHATIDQGWHLYGTDLPDGGPVSTAFNFTPDSASYRIKGALVSET
ncbi:MAG TPA: hypothetical protein VN249_07550, partial [Prolixibacteraceae bacterium]|nr:hypothetical protein [Prolixibacteraceae bacterium]